MSESDIETLDKLIAGFDTAMLVTCSTGNDLRARPMSIAKHRDGGAFYFASRPEDQKLEEILAHPDVAVTMQGDGRYLSVSGSARVLTSQLLAEELWSTSMRLWFPDGPESTKLTVIRVEPAYAEYWDRSGLKKLEFFWEAGKALLRHEKAADDKLSGHSKIEF